MRSDPFEWRCVFIKSGCMLEKMIYAPVSNAWYPVVGQLDAIDEDSSLSSRERPVRKQAAMLIGILRCTCRCTIGYQITMMDYSPESLTACGIRVQRYLPHLRPNLRFFLSGSSRRAERRGPANHIEPE